MTDRPNGAARGIRVTPTKAATDTRFGHRDVCSIVGIGATEFTRASGRTTVDLAAEASVAAVADAGLSVQDIDGIVRCDMDEVLPNDLAGALGLKNLTHWSTVTTGGTAPAA